MGLRFRQEIRIWRLTHKRFAQAPFDGEGPFRFGGRWNAKGVRCAYASSSSALTVLEVLVNADKRHLGATHVLVSADIIERVKIEIVREDRLPKDWRASPAPLSLQTIGAQWVKHGRTALLQVPSALVPGESNYLLNPKHPDFQRIQTNPPQPFVFDTRLL